MIRFWIALAMIAWGSASPAAAQGADADGSGQPEWYARDKALHFGISATASSGVYATGVELGIPRLPSAALSAAVVGAAGVWREIGTTDRRNLLTRRHLSRRDLVWDGIGIATGLAITELYYRIRDRRADRRAEPAAAVR